MLLFDDDLVLITNALYDYKKFSFKLKDKLIAIFGSPAVEYSNSYRYCRVENMIFAEQRLYRKRVLLSTGAILKRLGHKVIWVYKHGDNKNWIMFVDGVKYKSENFKFLK